MEKPHPGEIHEYHQSHWQPQKHQGFFPEVIRKYTGIDETIRIVIAVAIGYPDPDFPANRINSGRIPAAAKTAWYGFE